MFDVMLAANTAINSDTKSPKKENGEDKMVQNKIRNPFPIIGKVYKYEFKNLSRKIFPLFGAMLIIGLFIGIMAPKANFLNKEVVAQGLEKYEQKQITFDQIVELNSNANADTTVEDDSAEEEIIFSSDKKAIFFVVLTILLVIAITATWIVIVFLTDKRTKDCFLKNEASLNLTLPVTIGEHITGRFLVYLTFFILWGIAICLSLFLGMMKYFSIPFFKMFMYGIMEINNMGTKSLISLFPMLIAGFIIVTILYISYIFSDKAIMMLSKKHKTLMEFIVEIPLILIWIKIIYETAIKFGSLSSTTFWILSAVNIVLTSLNIIFTLYVYKKKINIE